MNNLLLLQTRILVPGFFLVFSGFFTQLPTRFLHDNARKECRPQLPAATAGVLSTSGFGPAGSTDQPDFNYSFTLFPNPAPGGQLTLKFSNVATGNAEVKIFNLVGKELLSQVIRITAKGDFTASIEIPQSLPSGAYLVKTDVNNSTCTKMLTLRKGA